MLDPQFGAKREDYDGALTQSSKAFRFTEASAPAWSNRSVAHNTRGDVDIALEHISEAVILDPTSAGAWSHRAAAKNQKGDWDGAIHDCDEALQHIPGFSQALSQRGAAKKEKGDYAGAIDDCDEALQFALPGTAAATFLKKAETQLSAGNYAEAVAACTEALALEHRLAGAMAVRGIARFKLGETRACMADLDGAVRLDPRCVDAWACRGIAKIHLDDLAGGIADCSEAVHLHPRDMCTLGLRCHTEDDRHNKVENRRHKTRERNGHLVACRHCKSSGAAPTLQILPFARLVPCVPCLWQWLSQVRFLSECVSGGSPSCVQKRHSLPALPRKK